MSKVPSSEIQGLRDDMGDTSYQKDDIVEILGKYHCIVKGMLSYGILIVELEVHISSLPTWIPAKCPIDLLKDEDIALFNSLSSSGNYYFVDTKYVTMVTPNIK